MSLLCTTSNGICDRVRWMEEKEKEVRGEDEDFKGISLRMLRPGSLQEEKYINYLIKKYKKIGEDHSICVYK